MSDDESYMKAWNSLSAEEKEDTYFRIKNTNLKNSYKNFEETGKDIENRDRDRCQWCNDTGTVYVSYRSGIEILEKCGCPNN